MERPGGHPIRVLVVDDEPLVRALLRRILVLEGYEVTEAGNGQSALDRLAAGADLVLLDVELGGESGLDVLSALRTKHEVPVIIVTGFDDEDDRAAGLRVADDYVVKPFSAEDLVARIARLLDRVPSGR